MAFPSLCPTASGGYSAGACLDVTPAGFGESPTFLPIRNRKITLSGSEILTLPALPCLLGCFECTPNLAFVR